MASGKSIELQQFDSQMKWRKIEPREKKERDRSLRGKDRIKARKAINKWRKRVLQHNP